MFIDIVRHPLSPEQQEAIPAEWGEVVDLKSGPWLETPANERGITELVHELLAKVEHLNYTTEERIYLHLPVGSPAFMFSLAQMLGGSRFARDVTCVFSHTERNVVEDAEGNKTSRFDFVKFLEFPSGWRDHDGADFKPRGVQSD